MARNLVKISTEFLKNEARTITVEPILFFTALGSSILFGAQITTNFLMRKVCIFELKYSEAVCQNLDLLDNHEAEEKVQIYVNNFGMNSQWISSVPMIIFAIIAGALSDEYDRVKPLILLPLIGFFLNGLCMMIVCAYVDVVPIQCFYLENISSFFGSYAVYYMGTYMYGTKVTKPSERAQRLARFDGFETFATMLGFLASPSVFAKLGYLGNFAICQGMIGLSIIYVIFFVEEPKLGREVPNESEKKKFNFLHLIVKSFVVLKNGLISLITRPRTRIIKYLIVIQFACFIIYWLIIEVSFDTYLYMLLVFQGFNYEGYSYFLVAMSLVSSFYLIVVMPIISGKYKLHDAMLLLIISLLEMLSCALVPIATSLWQFYLVSALGRMAYCKYAVVRSLLSKCIEEDEVGKTFSFLAVLAALVPVAGNPIFRELYNHTLDTFPSAIYLLCAAFLAVASLGNVAIFLKRKHIDAKPTGKSQTEEVGISNPGYTVDNS